MAGTCSVDDCDASVHARGWCGSHYARWRNGRRIDAPLHRRSPNPDECRVDDCTRVPKARSMCCAHYNRWLRGRRGDALTAPVNGLQDDECKLEECGRPPLARNMCRTHYLRWWRGDRGDRLRRPIGRKGHVLGRRACEDCGNRFSARSSTASLCPACTKLRHANRQHARRARTASEVSPVEVYERANWKCQLCGGPLSRDAPPYDSRLPSIDHIVPLSRGGVHAGWNVQAAHLGCNREKYNLSHGSQLQLALQ